MALASNWATQVIASLNQQGAKVPLTAANVKWLTAWQATEGGGTANTANNNPLNTTLGSPQSGVTVPGYTGSINSVGVASYSTPAYGAAATAQTLTQSNFSAILTALQTGNPTTYAFSNANSQGASGNPLVKQLQNWGSKTFASQVSGNEVPNVSSSGGSITSNLSGAGATQVPGAALGGLASLLGLPSGSQLVSYTLRALEVIGGAILAFAGLLLLAKQIGLSAPTPPLASAVAGAVE